MARFRSFVLFDPEVADGYMKHYVPVPEDALRGVRERLLGRIGAHEFRRVLHTRPDGSRCLKFGAGWLTDRGFEEGDEVEVSLGIDPDPDRVPLPEALAALLSADAEAQLAWAELTPGKQRTRVHGIERAKRLETRERRARAVVDELLERCLPPTNADDRQS